MTPIGAWCYDVYDAVAERASVSEGNTHQTALQVLKFFCYQNVIFLQDAAELLIVAPERAEHAMFRELAVLRSPEFVVSYVGRYF